MPRVCLTDATVSLPQPLYLLIEDVGWWRGMDGSAQQQPYRNRFVRRHCLADYQALAALGRRLSMRIGLGMVLGEWDRTDCLRGVTGATWQGANWDNSENRGPWLEEAAALLMEEREWLEIALHGLCHEFWRDGRMERSEFHDGAGQMRPAAVIRKHLDAYAAIMEANGLGPFPRLYVPPALNHSFGNGGDSMQAILAEYGIRYVITRFNRARQYNPPLNDSITWEAGVTLLERGVAPVAWHEFAAAPPPGALAGPVLPLHWGNLLHPDPARNGEVVDRWAEKILAGVRGLDLVPVQDAVACFRQAAAFFLADMQRAENRAVIDLRKIVLQAALSGPFRVKIQDRRNRFWSCRGGTVLAVSQAADDLRVLDIMPDKGAEQLQLTPNEVHKFSI